MLFNLARILTGLGILLKILQNRSFLLDQELVDHLLLAWLYDVHCVFMQEPGVQSLIEVTRMIISATENFTSKFGIFQI